jgi:hypothetical protein
MVDRFSSAAALDHHPVSEFMNWFVPAPNSGFMIA